jgi:hypothetical protein
MSGPEAGQGRHRPGSGSIRRWRRNGDPARRPEGGDCEPTRSPPPEVRAAMEFRPEALEEVRRLLVAAALHSSGRWSPAAADETHVARLDRAVQLSQDTALPPSARTLFDQAARTIQAVMEDEARQVPDGEDWGR